MIDLSKYKVLYLTVSKKMFEVMVTGEKDIEYRQPSNWIKSRLVDKTGKDKDYDYIKITNGYGKDKPYFIATLLWFYNIPDNPVKLIEYSNGLAVNQAMDTILIRISDIEEIGIFKIKELEK